MSPDDHAYCPRRARAKKPEVRRHHRSLGLPARLHQHLRAGGRAAGRQAHRPGARLERNGYTAGVICEKVARYAERIHHPDRLMQPLRRDRPQGLAAVRARSRWDDALDIVAEQFIAKARQHGSRDGVALLLRRHDGAGAARRHQPAAPRDEILALVLEHDLRDALRHRLDRRRRAPSAAPTCARSASIPTWS